MSKDDSRMDDNETDETDEVEETPVAVAEAVAPADEQVEKPELEKTEVAEEEKGEATPDPVPDLSDSLLKEVASGDPMKAALIEKAIAKEAQRLKDEWAGREVGWIEKNDRKGYAKQPSRWIEDKRKIVEYDKLREEIETLRRGTTVNSPVLPKEEAKAPPVKSALDEAKEFVTQNNIDEAQAPLIAKLFEKLESRMPKQVQEQPKVDVRKELALVRWEEEKLEAEADDDFKSNEVLQALAWAKSQKNMSPMTALNAAKKQLGIKPKVVTKVSGSPQQGKPAFAKQSGVQPTDSGVVKYDGKTDPLKLLKKAKYNSED